MVAELDLSLTEADFQLVSEIVYKHCGITLDEKKRELVRARIAKELRAGQFASAAEYLHHVVSDPSGDAFTRFINAISTNLTSFFREKDHFEYLTRTFLPLACDRRTAGAGGRLLVWSAACSSGEEPYSLAMTLLEHAKGAQSWDMRILATDISTRVLDVARKGVYGANHLTSVPDTYRRRYFTKMPARPNQPAQFEVSPDLRAMVRFRYLNLMNDWPFRGPFDFIFCRNVMIYFDKPTQERLVGRYWNCLRPGGVLFTGHSESLTGISHRFINRKPSIYEKP